MRTKMEVAEREDKLLTDMLGIIRFTEVVSAKLHRVLDEAKIYQVVTDEFAKSDHYTASILLLTDDGASLQLAETSIAPSKVEVLEKASGLRAKEYKIKLSKSGIFSQVVKEGKTVHANVSDIIREFLPRPLAYLISKTMGYEKQSSILTPLHKHGKVVGVLAMSCTDLCEYFTHSVENLALHISTALELAHKHAQRNRALQALKRYHDHLGELVEERTGELKTINEKLQEEITERKQIDEALQAEKNKLQSVIDAMEYGLAIQDRDYNIIYQSELIRSIFGDHLGEKCYRVYEGKDKLCDGCPLEKAFKDGKSHTSERRVVAPSGEVIFWENTANPIRDAGGRIVSCLEIARNITERKQAEEALQESREKFQKMFESVTDGISVVNLNGVIIEANQRAVEMHGFTSKDELLGRNALEMVASRDRERIAANMRRAIKEGAIRGVEYTLPKADGTEFPGELSTSVLRDASGKPVAHISIARDITERKRMEEALRESEERFRSIVENSQVGIMILDDAYRFLYVNDELCRISGYSREEVIGQDFRQFLDEESRQLVAERYIRRQRGEEVPPRYEFNIVRKDGQKRRVEISSAVIRDSAGAVRTVAQILDITARKQADEALQTEKNKLQSLVDAMEDGLNIQDADYNIIYQNEPSKKGAGGDRVGEKCYRAYEGREVVCDGCPVEKAFKDGKSHTAERKTVRPSGEVIFWENTANPIRDAGGRIVSCLEITRNITERKQAEEAISLQRAYFQQLFDNSPDAIALLNKTSRVVQVNKGFEALFGYRTEEVKGRYILDVVVPEDRAEETKVMSQAVLGGKAVRRETVRRRKDGSLVDVSLVRYPIRFGGEMIGTYVIYTDITERKQAEQALRESEEKFSKSFSSSAAHAICITSLKDGKFLEVNESFTRFTGYTREEAIGHSAVELNFWVKEEELERWGKKLQEEGSVYNEEFHSRMKSGEIRIGLASADTINLGGEPCGLTVIADITERKRAEEKGKQLQQELYLAQRLASVGELAAGVAHEINNPLTGVLGFSQRLMRKSTDKEVSRDLEIIHSEARRAADVVQNLLTFARRRQPKKEYANINDIVQRTLELRSYALQTSNVELVTALAPSLPQVMVDFPQIQEVFLNIILNAEQAMSEARGRGKLIIKTRRLKDQVRISFADDGPGISPQNIDKVFDPFFTTREQKGGTGLGLSACHGIVTEHGGRIYVRSKPGQGATFIVELPLSPMETTVAHQP